MHQISKSAVEMLKAWKRISLVQAPFVLEQDQLILDAEQSRTNPITVCLGSYEEYVHKFLQSSDGQFHLSLVSMPWCGDLKSAGIFILLLNPGLSACDYYSEFHATEFRQALVDNLHQTSNRRFPLVYLDPRFAWHPGATYVRRRLHWLVERISRMKAIEYFEALELVAKRVCLLQLVPYHSSVYRLSDTRLAQLESTQLVKAFVHDDLLKRDNCLIIVMRKASKWGLVKKKNVVVYNGPAARSASLSETSAGGRAIWNRFK